MTRAPDTEVLERAKTHSIEAQINKQKHQKVRHLLRLLDIRIQKEMYGELFGGKRPPPEHEKQFKLLVKESIARR